MAKICQTSLWVSTCGKHLTNFLPHVSLHDPFDLGLEIPVLQVTVTS